MGSVTRQEKYNKVWQWINPELESYGDVIDILLQMLTDEQLDEFLAEIVDATDDLEDQETRGERNV